MHSCCSRRPGPRPRNPEFKTGAELAVWAALGEGEAYIDDLSARAGLPARECLVAVSATGGDGRHRMLAYRGDTTAI